MVGETDADVHEAGGQHNVELTLGGRLRAAREAQGKSLEDIANATRVPYRHLQSIEHDDYSAIPGRTYSVGFVKAYAREVELNAEAAGNEVRRILGVEEYRQSSTQDAYEPADASRTPPRRLAWTALIAAILLGSVYALWRSGLLGGGPDAAAVANVEPAPEADPLDELGPPATQAGQAAAAGGTAPIAAGAPVQLVATDTVWLQVRDANGKNLFMKEMKGGERYDVPAMSGLKLTVGRPESLRIVVGGQQLPQIGPAGVAVKNYSLDTADLARAAQAPGATVPTGTVPAGTVPSGNVPAGTVPVGNVPAPGAATTPANGTAAGTSNAATQGFGVPNATPATPGQR